jgi:RpiB/LacA/LacB family sugar-phosphate isomerase
VKVAFASDHPGFDLKERLKARAAELGHEVVDLGANSRDPVDYPDFGAACGRAVAGGDAERGVVICGSGIGISIAANKVPGCRAALCHDHFTAEMARRHNDANVLALGARVVGEGVALDALETFLATPFDGGRHAARVEKLSALDQAHGVTR